MSHYVFGSMVGLISMALTNLICALVYLLFAYPSFDVDFLSVTFLTTFLVTFLFLFKPWMVFVDFAKSTCVSLGFGKDNSISNAMSGDALLILLNMLRTKPLLWGLFVALALIFFANGSAQRISKR